MKTKRARESASVPAPGRPSAYLRTVTPHVGVTPHAARRGVAGSKAGDGAVNPSLSHSRGGAGDGQPSPSSCRFCGETVCYCPEYEVERDKYGM